MTLKEDIKKARPNLAESSIRTYSSVLTNAYHKVYPDDKEIDIKKFNNDSEFIKLANTMDKPATLLASLVVITKNDKYQKLMMDCINKHKNNEGLQTKNEKQKEGMISKAEVETIYKALKNSATLVYKNKDTSTKGLNTLVNYILLSVCSGLFMEPRRSMDWALMRIKNKNDTDNYYDSKTGEFIFNKYKTSKVYNTQKEIAPKELKTILNKWVKYNPNEYLLFNTKNEPLNSANITTRLNEIFGKNISTSMLRHIFVSDKFANMPSLVELKSTAQSMGNSVPQLLEYIKK
jgi:hypothetical protein